MNIKIDAGTGNLFSIQSSKEIIMKIYHIIVDELHCPVTVLDSKSSESTAIIKAKLAPNKRLKEVADTLNIYFNGYISQSGDTFLISSKEDNKREET